MSFSWSDYRRQQQQERQQWDEQRRLDEAAEKLHQFVVEMMAGYGLSEDQLRTLLDVELDWYGGDSRYTVTVLDEP